MARQSYLEHSAVTVRDIEWSQKFFEKILGMTETRRKEKDGHLKMVWLKGGVQLVAAPEDYKAGQGHHLGIVVEDMPEVLREMLAVKGVHHIEGKPEKWVQLPDGLTLEVNCVDKGLPTAFWYAEVEYGTEAQALAWDPAAIGLGDYLSDECTGKPGSSMGDYWQQTRLGG